MRFKYEKADVNRLILRPPLMTYVRHVESESKFKLGTHAILDGPQSKISTFYNVHTRSVLLRNIMVDILVCGRVTV